MSNQLLGSNPLQSLGRYVSTHWALEYAEHQIRNHTDIASQHLAMGRSEEAEFHRSVACMYSQRANELREFHRTRLN